MRLLLETAAQRNKFFTDTCRYGNIVNMAGSFLAILDFEEIDHFAPGRRACLYLEEIMFARLKMTADFTKYLAQRFRREDDGLALTEYLVVLGLMIGGVIFAVMLFGMNLNIAWTQWAEWMEGNLWITDGTEIPTTENPFDTDTGGDTSTN
ncbi:hypothetical protein CLG85_016970 [Yangia mangrovi]|uniref:Uncharacterized protein n=1 Tax=Alloyangia mangrovi TaxID=1779329 RepID=A0ABT2KPB8_9RHOB|nr:hypothetical protein [Alloyangia mangrovi]MCT4371918.1 hypothetical protein [Alloyangia mangrovi]